MDSHSVRRIIMCSVRFRVQHDLLNVPRPNALDRDISTFKRFGNCQYVSIA